MIAACAARATKTGGSSAGRNEKPENRDKSVMFVRKSATQIANHRPLVFDTLIKSYPTRRSLQIQETPMYSYTLIAPAGIVKTYEDEFREKGIELLVAKQNRSEMVVFRSSKFTEERAFITHVHLLIFSLCMRVQKQLKNGNKPNTTIMY